MVGSIGLALGLAALLAAYADTTNETGATATITDKAFNVVVGATLGLAIGSAIAAALAPAHRIGVGITAGSIAYAAVLAPMYVLTTPRGVSMVDAITVATIFLIPSLIAISLGACTGAFVGARGSAAARR